MGCELHPRVVYTQFSARIKRQKELLQALIEELEPAPELQQKVYPGIADLLQGRQPTTGHRKHSGGTIAEKLP